MLPAEKTSISKAAKVKLDGRALNIQGYINQAHKSSAFVEKLRAADFEDTDFILNYHSFYQRSFEVVQHHEETPSREEPLDVESLWASQSMSGSYKKVRINIKAPEAQVSSIQSSNPVRASVQAAEPAIALVQPTSPPTAPSRDTAPVAIVQNNTTVDSPQITPANAPPQNNPTIAPAPAPTLRLKLNVKDLAATERSAPKRNVKKQVKYHKRIELTQMLKDASDESEDPEGHEVAAVMDSWEDEGKTYNQVLWAETQFAGSNSLKAALTVEPSSSLNHCDAKMKELQISRNREVDQAYLNHFLYEVTEAEHFPAGPDINLQEVHKDIINEAQIAKAISLKDFPHSRADLAKAHSTKAWHTFALLFQIPDVEAINVSDKSLVSYMYSQLSREITASSLHIWESTMQMMSVENSRMCCERQTRTRLS